MDLVKGYMVTFLEIAVFLLIGFILAQNVLSGIYESRGISYLGDVGIIIFGLSFFLLCTYTLFRTYVLSNSSPLLKGRISSITFWVVFMWSVYAIFSPFVRGEI